MGLALFRRNLNCDSNTYISPSKRRCDFGDKFSESDMIEIFADRTFGWQIDPADKCLHRKNEENEFASLFIICAYFEQIGHCISKGNSTESIKLGFANVFDVSKDAKLTKDFTMFVRNGLYHQGITKEEFAVAFVDSIPKTSLPIEKAEGYYVIYPQQFINKVKEHCSSFVALLRELLETNQKDKRLLSFLERMKEEAGSDNVSY
jgi:hypothetical protein